MTMSPGGLGIAHLADIEPSDGRDPAAGHRGPGRYTATDGKLDRRVAVRLLPPIAD